jgi:catalase
MFVDLTQTPRILAGQKPARRAVFLKQHGVAHGTFAIQPDLREDLRVGILRYERLPCWVRFSSDTVPGAPDRKTTVGIAVKLFNVPGRKIAAHEANSNTHDFILQNFDVFFVDTAVDMCAFTHAGVVEHSYDSYLNSHPVTKQVLNAMAHEVPSVLQIAYWSALPYAFGPDRYVKYKLSPSATSEGPSRSQVSTIDNDYLATDLKDRLLTGDATFTFALQFRTIPEQMPLERATVRWEEGISAPIPVATLTLPQQDVSSRANQSTERILPSTRGMRSLSTDPSEVLRRLAN